MMSQPRHPTVGAYAGVAAAETYVWHLGHQ